MRLLRFLVLLAGVLLVYLAQQVLVNAQLADLLPSILPPFLDEALPGLFRAAEWTDTGGQELGIALAALGALLFGLAATPWAANPWRPRRPFTSIVKIPRVAWGLVLAAVVGGGGLLVWLYTGAEETRWLQVVWVLTLSAFVAGAWLLDPTTPDIADSDEGQSHSRPEQDWPRFLLVLVVAGVLLGWRLDTVPLRVDGDPASHGLQAMEIWQGLESRLFAPGWANIPLLAYYPAALGMQLSGDWLLGNRLAGYYAGMLTLMGTWLLGCELFRRTALGRKKGPRVGGGEEGTVPWVQSDGRHLALLAVVVTGVGYTFNHFSRLPQYMEPVAWGVLGLWALMRGARTGSRLTLGVSGVLLGLTSVLYYSGRVFPIIALTWWIGLVLARRSRLNRAAGGPGWTGFLVWGMGGFVFMSPFLGYWLRNPYLFTMRMHEVSIFGEASQAHMSSVYDVQGLSALLWENFKRTALTFNQYADTSTHFGYNGPMLDNLLGPLFFLALGILLLNLDRLLNWQLLLWWLAVVVLGGVITINAPFWPRLLPILPGIGLASALVLDRLWATLYEIGGRWAARMGYISTMGLIVLALAHNWIGYYEERSVYADPATYAGRALRGLSSEQVPYLIDDGDDRRARWDDRIVQFLSSAPYRPIQQRTLVREFWPAELPDNSVVLLEPDDRALAAELEERYPDGIYLIQRDRLGNPVLVMYDTP